MRRRGIVAAFMAFAASIAKGQDKDKMEAIFTQGGTIENVILLSLDMQTIEDHDPNKEFAIQLTYRGETIRVRMSDVMNELRVLNVK